jgi:hypothetical protein
MEDSCFIKDVTSDAVRATATGIEEWGKPFARAGYDIRRIRKASHLKNALEASAPYVVQDILAMLEEGSRRNPAMKEDLDAMRKVLDLD